MSWRDHPKQIMSFGTFPWNVSRKKKPSERCIYDVYLRHMITMFVDKIKLRQLNGKMNSRHVKIVLDALQT